MPYDPTIHHRRSVRLETYDYSQSGMYFVTVCTHERMPLFGNIVDGEMRLSAVGAIAEREWTLSLNMREQDEVSGVAFVVMPNHVHGIVVLERHDMDANDTRASTRTPLQRAHLLPRSLGAFIAGYKSAVTTAVNTERQTPGAPVWQRSYYDHVIRDAGELERIREYIANNPLKWSLDRENPANWR